jgi:transposase-like protein
MPKNDDLLSFTERFPDENSCRLYLEKKLWNNKPVCPHCESQRKIYRYANNRLFKCADCNRQFQVTTGTIYENSNLPLRKWFLAMYLISTHKKGMSSVQLAKSLGITQKSAWYLAHKIRYMLQYNQKPKKLSKVVEVDETYVGGRKRGSYYRGRSVKHKTPVFGMLQRGGELIIMPVPDTKRKTLEPIILKHVEKGSKIMSDEWWAYKHLHKHYTHETVLHGAREYARGKTHVNGLEGAWSLLKRSIRGIYHRPSRKHLEKYCAEFQFKYNSRQNDENQRFQRVVNKSKITVGNKKIIG